MPFVKILSDGDDAEFQFRPMGSPYSGFGACYDICYLRHPAALLICNGVGGLGFVGVGCQALRGRVSVLRIRGLLVAKAFRPGSWDLVGFSLVFGHFGR